MLNEKQKRFVDFYIQTGNATQAARLAGYEEKSARQVGSRLLQNSSVKNAIDERLKELDSQRLAKDREILEFLTSVMRGEVSEVVVVQVGGKGDLRAELIEKPFSGKERLKAAEILAKINGLFKEKTEPKADAAQILIDTLSSVWARRGVSENDATVAV